MHHPARAGNLHLHVRARARPDKARCMNPVVWVTDPRSGQETCETGRRSGDAELGRIRMGFLMDVGADGG